MPVQGVDATITKGYTKDMQRVIDKQFIRVREPVVVFPLKEWERFEAEMEELEEAARFNTALKESEGKKMISLEALGKKYKLN